MIHPERSRLVIKAAENLRDALERREAEVDAKNRRRNTLTGFGIFGIGAALGGLVTGGTAHTIGHDQAQSGVQHVETVPKEAGHYKAVGDISSVNAQLQQPQYRVWCEPNTSGRGTLHHDLDLGGNIGASINVVPNYEGCAANADSVTVPAPLSGLVEIAR